jgi:hypothetical protein
MMSKLFITTAWVVDDIIPYGVIARVGSPSRLRYGDPDSARSRLAAGPLAGRPAAIYALIQTAKLNGVDPYAWLPNVLARLQDHPAQRIDELLPWNWKLQKTAA